MDFNTAQAKAEADLYQFLLGNSEIEAEWLVAFTCYMETITAGLITKHLRPDRVDAYKGIENFQHEAGEIIKLLWERHFWTLTAYNWSSEKYPWYSDRDFFDATISSELKPLWTQSLADFWSKRTACLEREQEPALCTEVQALRSAEQVTRVEHSAQEPPSSKRNPVAAQYPKRAEWLGQKLRERGWSKHDLSRHGGPDHKTVQKVLDGVHVREDVLGKIAQGLSGRHGSVNLLDIPKD